MFINLGNEATVKESEIIGFFDIDNATVSVRTRNYLSKAEKDGRVINAAADLPKVFVVCTGKNKPDTIYLSQFSSRTLLRRMKIDNGKI